MDRDDAFFAFLALLALFKRIIGATCLALLALFKWIVGPIRSVFGTLLVGFTFFTLIFERQAHSRSIARILIFRSCLHSRIICLAFAVPSTFLLGLVRRDAVFMGLCLQGSVHPLRVQIGRVAGKVWRVLKVEFRQVIALRQLGDKDLSLLGPACRQNHILSQYLLATEHTEHRRAA